MTYRGTDRDAVSFVAAILEIGEFDLFGAAWEEWYGAEPDQRLIEADFGAYLDHGVVPFYVTGYTRKILSDEEVVVRERNARLRAQFAYYVPLMIFFALFMYFLLK